MRPIDADELNDLIVALLKHVEESSGTHKHEGEAALLTVIQMVKTVPTIGDWDEMPDLDKTIRGLECCNHLGREHYRGGCARCPYRDPEHPSLCRMQMAQDALELLRGQEAVKPIKTPETFRAEYNCGKCTEPVGVRLYDGDWYFKANYCQRCGREVMWDAAD